MGRYYPYPYCPPPKKPYSFWNFLFDVFMIFATCGVWLIWIFVREMRNN